MKKNQQQTGSLLVRCCDVPSGLKSLTRTFDALKSSWLLSWNTKDMSCGSLSENWNAMPEICYRENLQPCNDQLWIESVKDNANMNATDSVHATGIMVRHACVRTVPTDYPCYIKEKGRDFIPLDRLQNTLFNAGTPVYISHYSKDRGWVMVMDQASKAAGFVKAEDVATIALSTVDTVKRLPIAVFLNDHEPLYNAKREVVGYSRLGQVAFVRKQKDNKVCVLWPKRSVSGSVRWEEVWVPLTTAAIKPLVFSSENVTFILNQLLGKPYGWGGTLGHRDCSSMIQDYFRIFGCSLPRNSKAQMQDGGQIIDLSGKSKTEKERLIIQQGVPYKTILYAPGHVALYTGVSKGRVLMAHAVLSSGFVKNGYEGSRIIGKSIVSTLYFDAEIPGLEHSFVDKLAAMTIVH